MAEYWQSFDARTLGAKGDNVTDDTAAIQSGLKQACTLYIPPGRYRISQLIVPPECRVIGGGCNQTWLYPTLGRTINGSLITDGGNAQKIQWSHIGISAQNQPIEGLIKFGFGWAPFGTQAWIQDCQIRDCPGYGVKLDQNVSSIENTYFHRCHTAMDVIGNALTISKCIVLAATRINLLSPCIVMGLHVEASQGKYGLELGRRAVMSGVHFSLSQSIDYAMLWNLKQGSLNDWLFDAKPGAKCKWAKFPGGEIVKPADFSW